AGSFAEGQFQIGTRELARCGVGGGQSTAWPSDFVSGGIPGSTDKITLTDLTSFLAPVRRLDKSPGDPRFDKRWDLVPGRGVLATFINIQDLTALLSGLSGYPPMFNGAKAFGSGMACTAHPVYGD